MSFKCEFCGKEFTREISFVKHLCKWKRRFLDKDERYAQLGFMAWSRWYHWHQNKQKNSYEEFMRSQFYLAFIKFGRFMRDNDVIEPKQFVDFLCKAKVPIDSWANDVAYKTFLVELTKKEPPMNALERNVLLFKQWGLRTGNLWNDFFELVNPAEAVNLITNGRLSPWVLMTANKKMKLFDRFTAEQLSIIDKAINVDYWSKKVARQSEGIEEVRELCKQFNI